MKKYCSMLIIFLSFNVTAFSQTLDDYFEIAANNNPGLQAKYKSFEVAMEKIAQVSSLPDPSLSFGYFISPVETRVGPQIAKFSLTQMFPWFGTLKAQGNVAILFAEAKYQAFLEARNQLYYQVAAAYYPLYELSELIDIERENQRILESYKTIATTQFSNDKGDMVDVLRVDIMLKDATTTLDVLEQKRKPLETRFNQLLNRNASSNIEVNDTLDVLPLSQNYRKDSLLTNQPLLENLALKIKASKAKEQVAIKQGLPKIGVGLDYAIVGERSDVFLTDNGQDALMPMLSISIPIFRKKYKAAQKEAQLMQASYNLQKEELINQLISSYDLTWFEIEKQLEYINLYQNQIQESKQSLRLLFSAYSDSGKEFEEVLRMQQQILKYQKLKATALSEYHIALAKLDYITAKTK